MLRPDAPADREPDVQAHLADVDLAVARAHGELHALGRLAGRGHSQRVLACRQAFDREAAVGLGFGPQRLDEPERRGTAVQLAHRHATRERPVLGVDDPAEDTRARPKHEVHARVAAPVERHLRCDAGAIPAARAITS